MAKEKFCVMTYRQSRMEAVGISTPKEAFDCFFESFTLEECRELLWDFYSRCVLCYDTEKTVHENASRSLYFYTSTEMLFEAAWLLNNKNKRKKSKQMNQSQKIEKRG